MQDVEEQRVKTADQAQRGVKERQLADPAQTFGVFMAERTVAANPRADPPELDQRDIQDHGCRGGQQLQRQFFIQRPAVE